MVFEAAPIKFDEADVIDVKFLTGFHMGVVVGAKSGTARRKRLGAVGDIFRVHHPTKGTCPNDCLNARYVLTGVIEITLKEVADMFWDLEGVESVAEFIETWDRLPASYPTFGEMSEGFVFFHRFRRVR